MEIIDKLIDLRIILANICDGFSVEGGNKKSLLSTRKRILFELSKGEKTPAELISILCIAKSNLANILKTMIMDKVVVSLKTEGSKKNICYLITAKGTSELEDYKGEISKCFCQVLKDNNNCATGAEFLNLQFALSKDLEKIINVIKGESKL